MHCGNGLQRFACCLSKLQETEDAIGVAWTTTNCLHSYSNLEAHNVIGASAVTPTLVVKTENCLYVCLVHGYSVYIHPALFVRNAIFPHCMLVHVTTVAQETRPARQKGWAVGTNVTGTWKLWGKGGTTSKTYTNYSLAALHCHQWEVFSVLLTDRAISLWGPKPERSAIKYCEQQLQKSPILQLQ